MLDLAHTISAGVATLASLTPSGEEAWCPPFDPDHIYGYVEYIDLPPNWNEFRPGMKPVVTGITQTNSEIIGDTNYLTCELEFSYEPLERGEGIAFEGDSFTEIDYRGQKYNPYDLIDAFISEELCALVTP